MPCVTGFVPLVLKGPCHVICDADFLIASASTLHVNTLSHAIPCQCLKLMDPVSDFE